MCIKSQIKLGALSMYYKMFLKKPNIERHLHVGLHETWIQLNQNPLLFADICSNKNHWLIYSWSVGNVVMCAIRVNEEREMREIFHNNNKINAEVCINDCNLHINSTHVGTYRMQEDKWTHIQTRTELSGENTASCARQQWLCYLFRQISWGKYLKP